MSLAQSNPSLARAIFKGVTFSEEEAQIIASKFRKINLKKNDIIIDAGDVVSDLYYILNGCLRTYYTDNVGKEHTIQFGIEDWWITDYIAFFGSSKAIMKLEAIQDATLFAISREDREYLYFEIPKVGAFIKEKLERAYGSLQKRILDNLSQCATERYMQFVKSHPNIDKNVKNYHIASYLGITTESLSRIRNKLHKNDIY